LYQQYKSCFRGKVIMKSRDTSRASDYYYGDKDNKNGPRLYRSIRLSGGES